MNQTVTIFANGAHSAVEWRWKHGNDVWIAECRALAQVVQADSWSELLATIEEVQDSLMRQLYESGELNAFLAQHGWKVIGAIPQRITEQPTPRFEVPFELLHCSAGVERRASA